MAISKRNVPSSPAVGLVVFQPSGRDARRPPTVGPGPHAYDREGEGPRESAGRPCGPNFKEYRKSEATTEYKELRGGPPLLVGQDGWEEMADKRLT
jgi:hypothetical protein